MFQTGSGHVASLHLHPAKPGLAMTSVAMIEVVLQKGIVGNDRYFGRISRLSGQPGKRQVTLIEREKISGHAADLALSGIAPGAVRSNIETVGIDLVSCLGRRVQVGEATLLFHEARTPCQKMDLVCQGLRALMEDGRQGVIAQVLRGGIIRVGDPIVALPT